MRPSTDGYGFRGRGPRGEPPRVPMGINRYPGDRPMVVTREVRDPYDYRRSSRPIAVLGHTNHLFSAVHGLIILSSWGFRTRNDYQPGWVGTAERVGDAGKISFSALASVGLVAMGAFSVLAIVVIAMPQVLPVVGPLAALACFVAFTTFALSLPFFVAFAAGNVSAWMGKLDD